MIQLAALFLTIGALGLCIALSGYVLSILWAWFIVPVFGLPMLAIPNAIGLALVVSYLTSQYAEKQKNQEEGLAAVGRLYGHMLMKPLIALLIGFIVKQWL